MRRKALSTSRRGRARPASRDAYTSVGLGHHHRPDRRPPDTEQSRIDVKPKGPSQGELLVFAGPGGGPKGRSVAPTIGLQSQRRPSGLGFQEGGAEGISTPDLLHAI
jgi:hypothetical protein